MTDLDPLAWMYAAIGHIGNGEAGEIEGVWETFTGGDPSVTVTLKIIVRRNVQPVFGPPPTD